MHFLKIIIGGKVGEEKTQIYLKSTGKIQKEDNETTSVVTDPEVQAFLHRFSEHSNTAVDTPSIATQHLPDMFASIPPVVDVDAILAGIRVSDSGMLR